MMKRFMPSEPFGEVLVERIRGLIKYEMDLMIKGGYYVI